MLKQHPPRRITQDNDNIVGVIEYLDKIKARPSNTNQSKTERISNTISQYLIWVSGALFGVLFLAAIVHKLFYKIPSIFLPWILWVGVISQLSAIVALVMQSISGMTFIWFIKQETINRRKSALTHDLQCSAPLLKYKSETLRYADSWLSQFISRQERWQNMFIPGSDKLAILSYVGTTVAIFNQFMSTMTDTGKYIPWLTQLNINIDPFYLAMPLAGLFGIALGGMCNRIDIYHMQYKRDLIALALADPSTQKQNPEIEKTKETATR